MSDEKNVLRMQHEIQRSEGVMYFYEGEVPVLEGGIIEVPRDKPEHDDWVRRAYLNGYTLNADTGEPFGDVDTALAANRKRSTRRTKSDDSDDE